MKSPDEVRRELTEQWLAKANEDLRLIEHLASESDAYLSAIGFHAQQAAEKYFKALLVWHQVEFPKTHDLDQLLDLVADVEPSLEEALRDVGQLTPYGVEVRYPGDSPSVTREEAEQAVELARAVWTAIRVLLPGKSS